MDARRAEDANPMTITDKMIMRKDGVIGWMIFNNPERHNAMSLEMWDGTRRVLDDFEKDAAVRVVVPAPPLPARRAKRPPPPRMPPTGLIRLPAPTPMWFPTARWYMSMYRI